MNDKITTIRVHKSTKKALESFGEFGETHEQIIKKLLKIHESSINK